MSSNQRALKSTLGMSSKPSCFAPANFLQTTIENALTSTLRGDPQSSTMRTVEIQKMSTSERWSAMEQLWDASSPEGKEPTSPDGHQQILAQRKERMNSSEAQFYTFE